MKVTGLAHVCFTVADLDRALAFYRDGLGLKPAFDFVDEQGRRYGVYLHIGGRNFIELFEGHAEAVEGGSFRHFCLEVDDINDVVRTLRERGWEVSDPKLGKDHSFQAWTADPDGNRIEFHQYTPQSKQSPYLE